MRLFYIGEAARRIIGIWPLFYFDTIPWCFIKPKALEDRLAQASGFGFHNETTFLLKIYSHAIWRGMINILFVFLGHKWIHMGAYRRVQKNAVFF